MPATINTISKYVNGITDNLALSVMRAFTGTIYFAPAMNTHMYENEVSKDIFNKLNQYNTVVINPTSKKLACGDIGIGALAKEETIIKAITTPLFPLRMKYKGITKDNDSFKKIDITKEYEIPLQSHCGGFGFKRTHHYHEGLGGIYTVLKILLFMHLKMALFLVFLILQVQKSVWSGGMIHKQL